MALVQCRRARDKPVMQLIATLSRTLIDFALPPRCPACSEIVSTADSFCLSCWSTLTFLDAGGCITCGVPMEQTDMQCGACMVLLPRHDGVLAATAYNKVSSAVVMRYKYGRRPGLSRVLAHGMERLARSAEGSVLVPVPLHRWRLWQRGFNQSALVAKRLSKRLDMPVVIDALMRHRNTPPLRGLNPRQRRDTVQSAFSINPLRATNLQGRDVLLVDDVYTTGATANACAKILKGAGAGRVQILCWARALPGRDMDA